jgi:hypothetical protein
MIMIIWGSIFDNNSTRSLPNVENVLKRNASIIQIFWRNKFGECSITIIIVELLDIGNIDVMHDPRKKKIFGSEKKCGYCPTFSICYRNV